MNLSLLPLRLAALLVLVAPALAQARPGSIYDPSQGPVGLIANKTARKPGDLITILISEIQDVQNNESSTMAKATSLDYALTAFNVAPDAFGNVLPNLGATSADEFSGSANYQKKGTFTARITAMVTDVLPSGNLVIEGRREIRVDHETKTIRFRGVVRRFDVDAMNQIASEKVADAKISYMGSGELTRTTNRSGLGRLIHGFLSWVWPF